MKTLSVWILGVFALGLALGNIVSSSDTVPEITALSATPLGDVDCGEGREALLEPIDTDGTVTFKVRCIETETKMPTRVVPPKARQKQEQEQASAPVVELPHEDSRTWKESAVVIGGTAGAGAGIGAITKGKKGAIVGAAIGAASGAAYELIKKDKND